MSAGRRRERVAFVLGLVIGAITSSGAVALAVHDLAGKVAQVDDELHGVKRELYMQHDEGRRVRAAWLEEGDGRR